MNNEQKLKRIAEIIEHVDLRCQCGDVVCPTLDEMTQDEISEIYQLASSPSLPVDEVVTDGQNYITVTDCKNWQQDSLVRGEHCYNCVQRAGFPYHGQPDRNCDSFDCSQ